MKSARRRFPRLWQPVGGLGRGTGGIETGHLDIETFMPTEMNGLGSQQLQIVKCLALGLSRKQIADELQCSVKTVEFHISGTGNARSIYAALNARSDEQIVRLAVEAGMVKPGETTAARKVERPIAVELKGIEDLKTAMLRGATMAANHTADPLQINALVQCSDGYIRLVRTQMDAVLSGRSLTG